MNAESALIHPWRSCSCALPSLGAHHPVTCIVCTEIPTDFAHREGLIESIGQAICETVEFIPDVLVFRTSRRAADSAVHDGETRSGLNYSISLQIILHGVAPYPHRPNPDREEGISMRQTLLPPGFRHSRPVREERFQERPAEFDGSSIAPVANVKR